MRCSRWPIRSCRDGLAAAGALGRDGAATLGATGRGGAAICGAGRGAIAGRCCCGAAGRNAGAAGRAIAGGGAGRAIAGGGAGRAMAGGAAGRATAGGGAGRAMPGGGPAGRPAPAGGPCLFSWAAEEPTLAATIETPRRIAERRRLGASMIVATWQLVSRPSLSTRERGNRSMIAIAALRRRLTAHKPDETQNLTKLKSAQDRFTVGGSIARRAAPPQRSQPPPLSQ
jgi:hypothetical protein